LSTLARDNKVALVEGLTIESPKTSAFVGVLNNLKITSSKTLIVTAQNDQNIYLSSRNLQGVKVAEAGNLNTYDLLNAETLLLTEDSLKTIEQLYSTK
jgi:large subunit ribosomal protein L4